MEKTPSNAKGPATQIYSADINVAEIVTNALMGVFIFHVFKTVVKCYFANIGKRDIIYLFNKV
jgi:hypothetical protein